MEPDQKERSRNRRLRAETGKLGAEGTSLLEEAERLDKSTTLMS